MKPDTTRNGFAGTQISVDIERWGDTEREIVRHPGAIAIVAVDDQERITFVRQAREPVRKRLLELPAGTAEDDEEPLDTAKRELAEEAQLRAEKWRLAATFYSTPGFCDELVHVYIAEGVVESEDPPEPDPQEDLEIVRIPVAEVEGALAEIEDAKTLVGLLLYLRER